MVTNLSTLFFYYNKKKIVLVMIHFSQNSKLLGCPRNMWHQTGESSVLGIQGRRTSHATNWTWRISISCQKHQLVNHDGFSAAATGKLNKRACLWLAMALIIVMELVQSLIMTRACSSEQLYYTYGLYLLKLEFS